MSLTGLENRNMTDSNVPNKSLQEWNLDYLPHANTFSNKSFTNHPTFQNVIIHYANNDHDNGD